MTGDEVVLVPPKRYENRLLLRIIARLSIPTVIVALAVGIFYDIFFASMIAVLGVGVTTVIARARMRRNPTRLVLNASGIHYEEGSFTIDAPWTTVDRIDRVSASNGKVDGLMLRTGAIEWAASDKLRQFAIDRGLDKEVPLGIFEADWRGGEAGRAIGEYAPRLLRS